MINFNLACFTELIIKKNNRSLFLVSLHKCPGAGFLLCVGILEENDIIVTLINMSCAFSIFDDVTLLDCGLRLFLKIFQRKVPNNSQIYS